MKHRIQLDEDELALLSRPIVGLGGFQLLLLRLQRGIQGSTLLIEEDDVPRAIRYFSEYGGGGFQQRLGLLVEKLREIRIPDLFS